MTSYILKVKPTAKGRPRFNRRTGHAYTPKKTRDYERLIRSLTREHFEQPLEKPLHLILTFFVKPPKSWSETRKRKAERGEVALTARPDLDNYKKALLDGMDGVAFKDDSYVVSIEAEKRYGKRDEICVDVFEVDAETAY